MFGVLGQQAKDPLHLPEEKGREETGKEEEREIISVEQLGLDLTSQLFSEAGVTLSILHMRSQGSKQGK